MTPEDLAVHFIQNKVDLKALAALDKLLPELVRFNSVLFATEHSVSSEHELFALATLTSELYAVRNFIENYWHPKDPQ